MVSVAQVKFLPRGCRQPSVLGLAAVTRSSEARRGFYKVQIISVSQSRGCSLGLGDHSVLTTWLLLTSLFLTISLLTRGTGTGALIRVFLRTRCGSGTKFSPAAGTWPKGHQLQREQGNIIPTLRHGWEAGEGQGLAVCAPRTLSASELQGRGGRGGSGEEAVSQQRDLHITGGGIIPLGGWNTREESKTRPKGRLCSPAACRLGGAAAGISNQTALPCLQSLPQSAQARASLHSQD